MPANDNLAAFRRFTKAAEVLSTLPAAMAEYYANGGAGVGQAVVGDRFSGKGNSRFEPLSYAYAVRKGKASNKLIKAIKFKHGKGVKKIGVKYKSDTGTVVGYGAIKSSIPILVLSGDTRAAVLSRSATITQRGDVGYATFHDLPDYAKYLHNGTSRMPKRSPVEPDEEDMARVVEFAQRKIKAAIGEGSPLTAFGGATPRILP